MVDFLTPEERSARMASIRSFDTSPEMRLRRELHRLGFRYGLHSSKLPGKPDLVFRWRKVVVFVHGCFWHRHAGCKIATTPKSNTEYWIAKFEANVARDERVTSELKRDGWRVLVVWECQVQSLIRAELTAKRVARLIDHEVWAAEL